MCFYHGRFKGLGFDSRVVRWWSKEEWKWLFEPRTDVMTASLVRVSVVLFACVDRELQPMARAMARPRYTVGPVGGPADGFPAKGGRNSGNKGLEVELMDPCVHGIVKWQHRGVRHPESGGSGGVLACCVEFESRTASQRLAPTSFMRKPALQTVGGGRSSIRSTTGIKTPSSACTRRPDEFSTDGNSSARWLEQVRRRGGGGGAWWRPAAA
ncbi:hypothetical protein F511_10159 [Dorcoceras hygrometricum]|uniref:Uncharacterized protein n=1 Tax=Dorcoceras hygrometricum TaxID=472368 RepID=A0A2Z7D7P8_9LAMI|nr:hypothetical protein F511_10159 [Dorcoceras hygrometricum]